MILKSPLVSDLKKKSLWAATFISIACTCLVWHFYCIISWIWQIASESGERDKHGQKNRLVSALIWHYKDGDANLLTNDSNYGMKIDAKKPRQLSLFSTLFYKKLNALEGTMWR